jgi:hypothetical protein
MNGGFLDDALFDVNLALFDYNCSDNRGSASSTVKLARERTPLPSALLSCIRVPRDPRASHSPPPCWTTSRRGDAFGDFFFFLKGLPDVDYG